jgi:hypothetical protein
VAHLSRFEAVAKPNRESEEWDESSFSRIAASCESTHGSAGKAKVEKNESAFADGTSFVTASIFRKVGITERKSANPPVAASGNPVESYPAIEFPMI